MAKSDRPKMTPQMRHEEFAAKIIAMLEKGQAPWQQPWKAGELHPPFNPVSGTVYSGLNRVMLSEPDYADPRWMTFKHAQSQNYRVKKGSKSQTVVHWQWSESIDKLDENGRPVLDAYGEPEKMTVRLERPRVRFYSVFHADQLETENGQPIPAFEPKELEWKPNERAEAILTASGAKIIHDQRDRGFYTIQKDEIHLPPKENFANEGDYYSTAFHELGHWTRHPSRLNRENGPYGSEMYAREELRAHIASWMLSQDLGIAFNPEQNHASYVQDWIKVLKDDPYEIVRACSDAERIKQYIMGLDQKQEQAAEIIFSELENDGGQSPPVGQEAAPDGAAARLNTVIEIAAGKCAAATDREAMIEALLDADKLIHVAQDSPDYYAPGTEVESTLLQHMAWETRRLTESNAGIEGHAETLIYNLAVLAHIQGRRTNSVHLDSYRAVLQGYADHYHFGPDDTSLACGDLISFKHDFDNGMLEWSVDTTHHTILCRENADSPWREPTEPESKILESAGELNLAPIIRLRDGQFLTYDGLVHDSPVLEREFTQEDIENPAIYLTSAIEQITRLNAQAYDIKNTRSALGATQNLLIRAVASPAYNAPGTEVESALIKSMHYRCSLHDVASEPAWLLDSLNYSLVALGNIQTNRLKLEGKSANIAKLAEYSKDMGPQEVLLASGRLTDFKRDLDGKEKDWCWDRESGTVLCREKDDLPWRPLDGVEQSQLRVYDHQANLVPVVRLADGQVMTYDGQLHGPSLVQESQREVDTEIIKRYLENAAARIAAAIENGEQKSVREDLLKEAVNRGRNIISRPAFNSVAHTADAAMLKYVVHNLGPIAEPDAVIRSDELPFMLNDVLMMGQINAKRMSDHVTAGKFQKAIEANIRERFANNPERAEALIPRMTGRQVNFDQGLPSGRQWCRRLNDGAALYRNHDHDLWRTDSDGHLKEDFPGVQRPLLTPILQVDGKSFLTLDGNQYSADPEKQTALDEKDRETDVHLRTLYANEVLEMLVRPNLALHRQNAFGSMLATVPEARKIDFNKGEVKFNAFLDTIEKIGQRELAASALDSDSGLTMAQIENRAVNNVLEIIAATRELDYRGLDYAANEMPGPKYRVVPLLPVAEGEKAVDLQYRGQALRGLREARDGETPRVFAVAHQNGNALIAGFEDRGNAEGFTRALNGREITFINMPVPRFSEEKVMLEVPFKEKEAAKVLGATWDKEAKKWCARPGTDLTPLSQWIPQELEHNPQSLEPPTTAPARPSAAEVAKEVIYLNVAYKERREAKEAGAKWNAQKKLWYAPVGSDLAKLGKFLPENEPEPAPAVSPVEEFRRLLEANGFVFKGDPIMDGKIHRVPIEGKPGQRDGAYQAYADGVPNGWFENHRDGAGKVSKWVYSGQQLTPAQKTAMQAQVEQRREQLEKDRENQYAQAAERAFDKFAACAGNPVDPEHPYLKSKGVGNYGLHQDQDGNLLVFGLNLDLCEFPGQAPPEAGPRPDLDDLTVTRRIQTVQTIAPNGEKRFEPGSRKKGAVHLIGENQFKKIAYDQAFGQKSLFGDLKESPEILLAEGYATGASLYKATGLPVAVAFDAGNLLPVTEALRRKFPQAELTICADHDHTRKINVGLQKAYETARAVGGKVVFPQFTEEEKAKGLTDFNDLAQSRGIFAVTKQVHPRHREQKSASADLRHQADNPAQGFGLAM